MTTAFDPSHHLGQVRITGVTITPVAFKDPPLLNTVGVHEPFALRAIIEVLTDSGVSGFGETYGDAGHLARLQLAADSLTGVDVFNINTLRGRIAQALSVDTIEGGHGMSGMVTGSSTADRVLSAFDVAALDIQGKLLGRPVSDLLGGAVRDSVQFSGYLFYKWEGHPGQEADRWGAALDPEGIVRQARAMVDGYGFGALKLKAGVFPPEEEIAAIQALRAEFPDLPLRIDPNAAWTVETSIRVGKELDGVLEYLEDPTPGIEGMAAVRREVGMPLATNMCVVSFADVAPSVAAGAVDVILSDHHFWGGLRRSQFLAGITETFGLGLSMHSNSHLGISLAAMVHLAAATPNLDYACDTHWPWKDPEEDVIEGGVLRFTDGGVAVPTAPGLGIIIDRDALDRLHRQYLDCGLRSRDDTGYMQRLHPSYQLQSPRW
ncbi:Mandelate racemase/muconate lactonizing protein [Pseudarthrobacter chlorophenolicus A6]|uniref:glucarate dehydratase n=1 Tax=Pseudarthrobacter chlorophenolicus (strain ATCC 700700 / DSM 12829 / CIP 107037 / JCM 12360 / KCTC 9906 / NCIMB 13794 / A6) TaxID=452863 RepID=B8H864_PSECP|nr:glucarate dehydratase family protein [Pseudarthrobacter chlorophenolicus]ACL38038.1 Mandelate racemase/muconate lactonizing protein [Pseudarthrobacter chlorophenolicus A6]SDQ56211.1 glucarate dehydratase [Pseudarthrobacter chlorophenolicus]